jgi:hypothetical protein
MTGSTPRFLPIYKRMPPADVYIVNPRVMERALKEVAWFLIAIVMIEILELLHHHGYLILARLPL